MDQALTGPRSLQDRFADFWVRKAPADRIDKEMMHVNKDYKRGHKKERGLIRFSVEM